MNLYHSEYLYFSNRFLSFVHIFSWTLNFSAKDCPGHYHSIVRSLPHFFVTVFFFAAAAFIFATNSALVIISADDTTRVFRTFSTWLICLQHRFKMLSKLLSETSVTVGVDVDVDGMALIGLLVDVEEGMSSIVM